jgi:inner membrane protein YidH
VAEPVQEKLKDSAGQTKAAAQSTAHAAERTKDSADRRTVFAAERTYAAWVRAGFVALASGIGARKLLEGVVPGWMIVATGTALVLFSAFLLRRRCLAAALRWHVAAQPRRAPRSVPPKCERRRASRD